MAKTATKERKLTSKQEAFAMYSASGFNAYQSAVKAGYSENTALSKSSSWLENVGIQQAIQAHKQATSISAEELQVTPEVITRGLFKEAQTAETGSARVSAWRTLADIHGMMSGSQQELPTGLLQLLEMRARQLEERAPKSIEARMLGKPGETGEGGGTS